MDNAGLKNSFDTTLSSYLYNIVPDHPLQLKCRIWKSLFLEVTFLEVTFFGSHFGSHFEIEIGCHFEITYYFSFGFFKIVTKGWPATRYTSMYWVPKIDLCNQNVVYNGLLHLLQSSFVATVISIHFNLCVIQFIKNVTTRASSDCFIEFKT